MSFEKFRASTKVSPILRRFSNSTENDSEINLDLISTPSSCAIRCNSGFVASIAPSSASSDEEDEEVTAVQHEDIKMECLKINSPELRSHKAAADGDIESLHSFLCEDNNEPDLLDRRGFTALHHAAKCDRATAIDLLLDFGATVDVRAEDGMTPLFHAIRNNSAKAIDTLLTRNADINNQEESWGCSPLIIAISSCTNEIIQRLLDEKRCDVNLSTFGGMTPMHMACRRGVLGVCQKLLQRGARVMVRTNDEGLTPLHFAASNTDERVVTLLINSVIQGSVEYPMHVRPIGVDNHKVKQLVDSKDVQLNSPLHMAAQAGNLPVIEVLLKHGADVNAMNSNLRSSVHLAAFNGHHETVKVLVSKGATVNLRDERQRTTLHSAVLSGNKESVQFLIANGAEIDARDSDGLTPFLTAVTAGLVDCVDLLMKSKADVMARDKLMRSCLHLAVQKEREMVLKLLLKEIGLELVNLPDSSERTSLHYAAMTSNVKILHLILEYNGCCNIQDSTQKTPLHLAAEMGKVHHVEAFCRASLSCISQQDDLKRTPLHHAVMNRKKKVTLILIGMGADADSPDIHGWTPLMWSAMSGSVSITKLLLSHHVSRDHVDNDGNTAIHMAANYGHVEIVELLLDYGAQLLLNKGGLVFLDVAMEQNAKDVVMAIVKHDRWREALLHPLPNSPNPMEKLIAKFPAAAAVVMDHCIQRSPALPTHPGITTTYDFRLLDPGPTDPKQQGGERFFGLSRMVEHQQEDLLMHPLARKLLETKWSVFGLYCYWFNLSMYVIFLAHLTAFILVERSDVALPDPNSDNRTEKERLFLEHTPFNAVVPYIVTVFAVVHIAKEFTSIYTQGTRYFLLLTNLLEWVLYIMSFLFMLPYIFSDTGLRARPEAYWQMGTCAVFLGYLNFILFLRTFDYFGLYVTMFFEVLKSVMKAMVVFSMFIFAFALVFYILLKEEDAFANFGMAIMKVLVMTVGELEYSDILVNSVNKINEVSKAPLVPYPEFSFCFFHIFLFAMPIVLVNLLVGLAVGDIEAIRKTAFLRNKARKIAFVTEFEDSLPQCFARCLHRPQIREGEEQSRTKWTKFQKFLELWNKEEAQPLEDENEARLLALQRDLTKTKQKMKAMMTSLAQQREILMAIASNVGAELQTDRE